MQEIKGNENYKELLPNDIPWMESSLILLTMTGSYAYGTNTENSDHDYKGICIPPIEYYLGLKSFNEYNTAGGKNWKNGKDDVDVSILHLNKFVSDAMQGVPNNIEMLFVREEDIIYCNAIGRELIDNRDLFLTKAIRKKFGGYANGLKHKLINGVNRNNRSDLIVKYGYDTKAAMHCMRLFIGAISILKSGDYSTYMCERDRELLLAIRNGSYSLQSIIELIEDKDKIMSYWLEHSELRENADYEVVNNLLIRLNKKGMGELV